MMKTYLKTLKSKPSTSRGSEDPAPENRLGRWKAQKTSEKSKYTPVLSSKPDPKLQKSCKKKETITKVLKSVSPLNISSSRKIVISTEPVKKHNESSKISISTSLETIKPIRKILDSSLSLSSKRPQSKSSPSPSNFSTIREGSRIREIIAKTKTDVDRMWRKLVSSSNGIEPQCGSFKNYTIYIGKGNNHPLVKKLFKARPWWKLVETKETANLTWCQWKDKLVLASLNSFSGATPVSEELNTPSQAKSFQNNYRQADIEAFGLQLITRSSSYISLGCEKIHPEFQRLHNRLEFNQCLTNKKGLYFTMKSYCKAVGSEVFDLLPVTFNVADENDCEFQEFSSYYSLAQENSENLWIVKPGEFSNRGHGIKVCKDLQEISEIVKKTPGKNYIIQKYIENPLLINKRKFDIRCYAMLTSINGIVQGYFYLDGYLRTTSKEFTVRDTEDLYVHLTNDAVQKTSAEYGKFENGNKLSYRDFQKYLESTFPDKKNVFSSAILPKIKQIVKETVKAAWLKIDKNKRLHCFEVYGYDFMIDSNFRPWLIEVNTNPCLELSSPYLHSVIPAMLENAFRLAVDCLFPPPIGQHIESSGPNRFELIFHQNTDGAEMLRTLGENKKYLD